MRTPVLAATLATDGLIGTEAGPRDPGTAYVLAHHYAGRAMGAQGAWGFVRGGMGAISRRSPPRHAQRAPSCGPARRSSGSRCATAAPRRSSCATAATRRGTRDPGQRRPEDALPAPARRGRRAGRLLARARAWRSNGVAFKLNLALREPPTSPPGPARSSSRTTARRSTSRPTSTTCRPPTTTRARTACRARRCWSASCSRRPTRRWCRPASTSCRSSPSTFPTSAATGRWQPADRDAIADLLIVRRWRATRPTCRARSSTARRWRAPDLEALLGLPAARSSTASCCPSQIYEHRFATRTGIAGLYLCGSGAHPGGCVSGFPGRRAAEAVIADMAKVASSVPSGR